ncbi:transposase [Hydrogenibacillus schlegelii]|uniref:transposase n=1 Tax=Hydrogenibacillus schlegelii TaxID=1484 RepID=UPI0012E35D68
MPVEHRRAAITPAASRSHDILTQERDIAARLVDVHTRPGHFAVRPTRGSANLVQDLSGIRASGLSKRTTNGDTEGVHTKITRLKRIRYGFKNREVYVRKMPLVFIPFAHRIT